jgi:hypothetical protein
MATAAADWNLSWAWNEQGFNGTKGSGSGSHAGNLSGTFPVALTGYKVVINHGFDDHQVRVGVLLVVQGPFDCYDAFLLVPHDFDLFGGAAHGYDSLQFGSAGISGETLALSPGAGGYAVTAADQTFGSADTSINAMASPVTGVAPAATSSPGTTVQGQPMSVAQAQSEAQRLTNGAGSGTASVLGGALFAALIAAVVLLVVGTVGVIEWRSYARRKSKGGLVGGYGESWPNGVPPATAYPPTAQAPQGPMSGPGTVEDPNRRL